MVKINNRKVYSIPHSDFLILECEYDNSSIVLLTSVIMCWNGRAVN